VVNGLEFIIKGYIKMHKPIWIQIHKKIRVPSIRKIKHNFRSDWKQVNVLNYDDINRLFTCQEEGGQIISDVDFIQAIFNEFGEGDYYCLAGGKGFPHFWNFLMFRVDEDGNFIRTKSNTTFRKRKKVRRDSEIEVLESLKDKTPYMGDWDEIDEKIKEVKWRESLEQSGELNGKKRFGPYPYLKITTRIHKLASVKPIEEQKEEQGFW